MKVGKSYETSKKPVVSFEFFPPRDEKAEQKFDGIVDKLANLNPDYMSVTFGAGGSTREGSYQTVHKLFTEKQLPTVAYIAGYGLGPDDIKEVLDRYQSLGIQTIFVIRGDKPRNDDFKPHPDTFNYASEMIAFINESYDFDLGCAGYPEGHINADSLEKDIEFLKLKVNNGAKYVVAQYCYDNNYFFDFIDKCRATGISVPIIPGIMPVYTIKMTRMLAKVCGATITDGMKNSLDKLEGADKGDILNYGIDFAVQQCRELLENKVTGLHFYTMDRSKSVIEIINRLRGENLL